LDLALLIDAQNQRSIGRVEIETDDIANLLEEQGIGRQLEGLGAVRLKAEGLPDAMDRGRRVPDGLSHGTQRPVRRVGRPRFQRHANRLRDLLIANLARGARARLIVKTVKMMNRKSTPPLPHCVFAGVDLVANGLVLQTVRSRKDDPRSSRQSLPRLLRTSQTQKLNPLSLAQCDRNSRLPHPTTPSSQDNRGYFSIRTLAWLQASAAARGTAGLTALRDLP
jgi:hypothetical protein